MKILIADDHEMFRSGLEKILLGNFPKASIEGASNCQETNEKLSQMEWSLLVLDISMEGKNSLDFLHDWHKKYPKLPIIILSMHEERPFIIQSYRNGAMAYLTKEKTPNELIEAIETIMNGKCYINKEMGEHFATYLQQGSEDKIHEHLSSREYEIFICLASAFTVTEVAKSLNISVKTVSTHRKNILEKMQMSSNNELMRYAAKNQLLALLK